MNNPHVTSQLIILSTDLLWHASSWQCQ